MVLIPIAALVAFVVLASRALADVRPVAGTPSLPTSATIARIRGRLMRGEIDRSDYERIMHILLN